MERGGEERLLDTLKRRSQDRACCRNLPAGFHRGLRTQVPAHRWLPGAATAARTRAIVDAAKAGSCLDCGRSWPPAGSLI